MNKFSKYSLYFISTIAVLALALVVYLVWFQPPFYFPKPTGPYAVGSKEYHWVDIKRKETLANDPQHPYRELMVTIWYPVQPPLPERPASPYAQYAIDYYKDQHPIAWLLGFSRPHYVYTNPDVPMAINTKQFPVIIFSHCLAGTRDRNTAQCEELASHGYLVVGISHTYESCIVQFPDHRSCPGIKSIEQRLINFKTSQADRDIETRISDVCFVLDQLAKLANNKESIFYLRLDLRHIGIFGHSYGGATAIQLCQRDARIKAGVNLDGPLFGPDVTKKFNKPCMFMLAEKFASLFAPSSNIGSPYERNMVKSRYLPAFEQLSQAIGHDAYIFLIKTAGHLDFSDIALFKNASPVSQCAIKLGPMAGAMSGSIDGFRIEEIINTYLVNFFDKYLKGKPSALLDGANSPYPEVEVKP